MNKYLKKDLSDLHYKHQLTHKVAALVFFSILVLLTVYGLSRVKATKDLYEPVPNANHGVCYKVGEDFNNPANHVSCKTYKSICQTKTGTLVECDTGAMIK